MTTEILKLTEVLSTDADKFTIHNTALREIESRLIRVKSKTNGGPPGSPANGDTYIVDVASGAWASFTVGNIAHYYGGAWTQALPLEGWREWVNDADREHIYNGTNWNTYNINSGPATSATSLSIIDNTANAFQIVEGANEYIGINTTNGSETVDIATNGATVNITGVTAHTENVSLTKSTNGAIKIDLSNINTGTSANAQIRFTNDNTNYASINLTGINYSTTASWADSLVMYTPSAISGGLKLSIDTGGVKISTSGLETSDFVVNDSGNVSIGQVGVALTDKLNIYGAKILTSNIPQQQLTVIDTSSQAAGVGGAITFVGKYETGGDLTGLAAIEASKSDGVSGNFGGDLILKTRINGAGMSDAIRIDSSQNVTIAQKILLPDGSASAPSIAFSDDTNTGIYSNAANSLVITTDGSNKVEINTTDMIMNNSLKIDANSGIKFNGNTDVLNNYDEGTWTPSIVDSSFSGSEGVTYSVQVGTYTRIGDEVHIQGQIIVTSLGTLTAGDPVYLAGLPFTAENVSSSRSGISVHAASGLNITAGHSIEGRILENTSYVDLQVWDSTAGTTNMLVSELSATGDIVFSGNYKV